MDGNTYVDLSCGYGPHILGYNHPHIHEKLEKAIELENKRMGKDVVLRLKDACKMHSNLKEIYKIEGED